MPLYSLLACTVSDEKSAVILDFVLILYFVPYTLCFLFCSYLLNFLFFLCFKQFECDMNREMFVFACVCALIFILLELLGASCIYVLVSVNNFGKFLVTIF